MGPTVHWKDDDRMHNGGHPTTVVLSVTRRAILELPVDLDVTSNNYGLSLRPASKLTLSTAFPLLDSLSASIDAKAGIRGQHGYYVTRTGLTYQHGLHRKVSLHSLWDHGGKFQNVTLSAQTTRPEAANLQVSLQSQHQGLSKRSSGSFLSNVLWKPTIIITKPLSETIVFRTHASLTPFNGSLLHATGDYTQQVAKQIAGSSSIDNDNATSSLTLADCPMQPIHYGVSVESPSSRHAWSFGFSHSKRRPYQLQWSLAPRLYEGRSLSLSGSYRLLRMAATSGRLSNLQFAWSADQDHTKTASPMALSRIQLSVSDSIYYNNITSGGPAWAWIVSVTTRGDFTLRVPIVIATSAMADPLLYPAQALYVGAVSWLVQEAAVRLVKRYATSGARQNGLSRTAETDKERRKRERQEAENQQALMKFQANRRKTAEKQSNGLVINVAVYYTVKEKLDVTVPLRFWVTDSSLVLAETTKSNLLGFYDMSSERKHPNHHQHLKRSSWISGFWSKDDPTLNSSISSSRVTPKLSVEYTYRGASYQLTVEDDEALVLPSDQARLVRPAM
ncbi:hypothetical protein MPSEU_000132300 [Mayamaea pseudoterrestris]|nr:hypothetical protein MPSEU_000132300 [Mayamaea pseudoterrestris]